MCVIFPHFLKKRSRCFLEDAIDEVIDDSNSHADIVINGPPIGGQDSDIEISDDENICERNDLPNEVAGEIYVFYEDCELSQEDANKQNLKKKLLNGKKLIYRTLH